MALQKLDLGVTTGDKKGDGAKDAGAKINSNFEYLDNKIDNMNQLLVDAGFSLSGNILTINAGWQWKINGINYTNPVAVTFTIPFAAVGKKRRDIIVMNTSNTFTKFEGAEVTGTAVTPALVAQTVLLEVFNVTESNVYGSKSAAPFLGSITPASVPTGSGAAYWHATQAGTYANFGSVVVAANSFAVISRNEAGGFSISQTALDLTNYATKTYVDTNSGKIKPFVDGAWPINSQVNSLGKDWYNTVATVAGEIPGTSPKWVDRLSGYISGNVTLEKVDPSLKTDPSLNIFDYRTLSNTAGFYGANDVLITSPAGYNSSDYIPVTALSRYYIGLGNLVANALGITFYNASKVYISLVQTATRGGDTMSSVVSPANAFFMRVPIQVSNKLNWWVIKSETNILMPSPYYKENSRFNLNNSNAKINGNSVTGELSRDVSIAASPNLLNLNDPDILVNQYITSANVLTNAVGINESGFIPLVANRVLKWTQGANLIWNNAHVVFYDINKNHIGGISNPSTLGYVVTTLVNCAFVRICYSPSYQASLMISYDSNVLVYEAYKEKANLKDEVEKKAFHGYPNTPKTLKQIEDKFDLVVPNANQWQGATWYAYGTSITSTIQGEYAQHLIGLSGMTLVNKGIAGGGIGNLGGYSTGQVLTAIRNTTDGKLNADLITLEVGANDTAAAVPLGTIYDTDTTTLCGCLNLAIRYLQENTNAQIVVMPSVVTKTLPNAADKYYEAQILFEKVCLINKVYWLNGSCGLGYARIKNDAKYTADTIHQTELGGLILAKYMWNNIKNIPKWDLTV